VTRVLACEVRSEHLDYREWLRGQYGSLESLNREWGSAFADWDADPTVEELLATGSLGTGPIRAELGCRS